MTQNCLKWILNTTFKSVNNLKLFSLKASFPKVRPWQKLPLLPPSFEELRSCLRNQDEIGLSVFVLESNFFLTEFTDTGNSTSWIGDMSIPSSVVSASSNWFVNFKESSSNFFLNSSASNVPVMFRISLIRIPLFFPRHSSLRPLLPICSGLKTHCNNDWWL